MSEDYVQKSHLILKKLRQQLNQSMVLDKWLLDQILISVLSKGHILLEAAPGLGKTTLVKVLAKSMGLDNQRVQCTPDLMPSDITGANVYNPKSQEFTLHKGPVFTQLLLVDEINRTSPRTQSALLQAMAESCVTLDRETYSLDEQFLVIATQNPVEYSGTYPLPEAQLDRFFVKLEFPYPSADNLKRIAKINLQGKPEQGLKPLINPRILSQLQNVASRVTIKDDLIQYTSDICDAINQHKDIRIGVSPRACVALLKACKAYALLQQRQFVTADDILIMATPVLAHRIVHIKNTPIDKRFFQEVASQIPAPGTQAQTAEKQSASGLALVD